MWWAFSQPVLFLSLYFQSLPESPFYDSVHGNVERAHETLKYVAESCNTKLPPGEFRVPVSFFNLILLRMLKNVCQKCRILGWNSDKWSIFWSSKARCSLYDCIVVDYLVQQCLCILWRHSAEYGTDGGWQHMCLWVPTYWLIWLLIGLCLFFCNLVGNLVFSCTQLLMAGTLMLLPFQLFNIAP